ncbi:MAG: hypothetical protein G01um101472_128 [Parcubacteria group bacterium Gr01-1014_72]|nr:MAG: hypothetical protein G01um101472_128 [Parcubacteria group bacterium Gr01-1014_72]
MKEKTAEELKHLLTSRRAALRAFFFGTAGSKSKNVREGRMLRREVARIMTELRVRERAGILK